RAVLAGESLPAFELHGFGTGDSADRLVREQPVEHVEADVPARGAPRDEAAIDAVPEGESRTVAVRLELPPDVAVLEHSGRFGSRHARLRDRRRAHPVELHGADGGQIPADIEWRPLRHLRRIGQRLPDLRRRVAKITDENEGPLLPFLSNLRPGGWSG